MLFYALITKQGSDNMTILSDQPARKAAAPTRDNTEDSSIAFASSLLGNADLKHSIAMAASSA